MSIKHICRALAVSLAAALTLTAIPAAGAFAEGKAADITVYMTISNKGSLAKAKDDSPMTWKEVVVSDIDEDGLFSFDEALTAAHSQYYKDGVSGYATISSSYGVTVDKLWGVEASPNYLFFKNGQGLSSGVGDDYVSDGDYLTSAILSDNKYFSDYLTSFDQNRIEHVAIGETVVLTLKGHLGMAWTPEDMQDVPLSNMLFGDWDLGILGKTDENGKARMSFNQPGTYRVTAIGTVKTTVTDYSLNPSFHDEDDNVVYAKAVPEEPGAYLVAYTEKDYGPGPYPESEVKYIDYEDWMDEVDEETFSGHTLRSNQLLFDSPIISPVCLITVDNVSFDELKGNAVQKLMDAYNLDDYRSADKPKVLDLIVRGQAAINKASNSADIQTALDTAMKKLAGIKTIAQLTAETKKVKATQVKGVKVTAGKKKATVKWTKNAKVFTGYQISYKKAGAAAKTVNAGNVNSKVIKKLVKGKKYTFKVRGFKKIAGKTVYGKWSAAKTVKIK